MKRKDIEREPSDEELYEDSLDLLFPNADEEEREEELMSMVSD